MVFSLWLSPRSLFALFPVSLLFDDEINVPESEWKTLDYFSLSQSFTHSLVLRLYVSFGSGQIFSFKFRYRTQTVLLHALYRPQYNLLLSTLSLALSLLCSNLICEENNFLFAFLVRFIFISPNGLNNRLERKRARRKRSDNRFQDAMQWRNAANIDGSVDDNDGYADNKVGAEVIKCVKPFVSLSKIIFLRNFLLAFGWRWSSNAISLA